MGGGISYNKFNNSLAIQNIGGYSMIGGSAGGSMIGTGGKSRNI